VRPDVVVDVGNTRMKWGRSRPGSGITEIEAVPLNLGSVWHNRFEIWNGEGFCWVVAGSNPDRRDEFATWLRNRKCHVAVLTSWKEFGISVRVPSPERVGHDRLLNARAAIAEIGIGVPAVIVDAGTAVTVDLLDESGAFAGGTIFPGVTTMARSLHQFTARLPEVKVESPRPSVPGNATESAIQGGIWWAVVGGIEAIIREYQRRPLAPRHVLLTGGDADLLLPGLRDIVKHRPHLTLEGIRIAAESLP
jgi:type III pantothenate kinase